MEMTRAPIHVEGEGSITWRPTRGVEFPLTPSIQLTLRCKCEQIIRAHIANIAVREEVGISRILEKVVIKFRWS